MSLLSSVVLSYSYLKDISLSCVYLSTKIIAPDSFINAYIALFYIAVVKGQRLNDEAMCVGSSPTVSITDNASYCRNELWWQLMSNLIIKVRAGGVTGGDCGEEAFCEWRVNTFVYLSSTLVFFAKLLKHHE